MKRFVADYDSEYPVYYQLYTYLKGLILDGTYKPGVCVPSENEMIAEFGVSRATVRRAIGDLERDGYLKRYRGKGSVVLEAKSTSDLTSLYSFTEAAENRGERVSYVIIDSRFEAADFKTAQRLNIPYEAKVFSLKRILLLNGRIAGITTAHIPYFDEWADVYEHIDEQSSLFKRFQENGIIIDEAKETLEIKAPSIDIKRALYIEDSSPIVFSEQVAIDVNGKAICFTESYFIYSKFRYSITIKRK